MKKLLVAVFLILIAFTFSSCNRLSKEERIWSDLSKLEDEYSDNYDLFISQLSEFNPEFEKIYALNEEYCDALTQIEDDLFTLTHYFDQDEDTSFSEASDAIEHIREVLRPFY